MPRTFSSPFQKAQINTRQLCFFAAFLLPASKLLEAPSLLAKFAASDLLLPAFFHFLLQTVMIITLFYVMSRSERSLLERLRERLGKAIIVLYVLYAAYFIFAVLLPIFDFEKFVYAAFFDTAPTMFAFTAFFFFAAFVCVKGIKAIGRSADLCLFLFLLPFLALLGMSIFQTDFTSLLPLFGTKFGDTMYAFTYTTPHFSDAILLLPLLLNKRYEKGDGVKVTLSYWIGAALSLLFFAVFFGLFSSIAQREHYAFSKIAQYFPALSVTGRIDLLFVYALSIVLLFYTCLPLQYATYCILQTVKTDKSTLIVAVINAVLFLFILNFNRYYNNFYAFISGKLFWIFWLFADILPLFLLLLPAEKTKPSQPKISPVKTKQQENPHA